MKHAFEYKLIALLLLQSLLLVFCIVFSSLIFKMAFCIPYQKFCVNLCRTRTFVVASAYERQQAVTERRIRFWKYSIAVLDIILIKQLCKERKTLKNRNLNSLISKHPEDEFCFF